ncbi:unnamed protein product [Lampetra fluviatilis]
MDQPVVTAVRMAIYSLLLALGLPANVFVIYRNWTRSQQLPLGNLLIVNLSLADLLHLVFRQLSITVLYEFAPVLLMVAANAKNHRVPGRAQAQGQQQHHHHHEQQQQQQCHHNRRPSDECERPKCSVLLVAGFRCSAGARTSPSPSSCPPNSAAMVAGRVVGMSLLGVEPVPHGCWPSRGEGEWEEEEVVVEEAACVGGCVKCGDACGRGTTTAAAAI